MKESEIAEKLENAGFVLQPKRGIAIDAGRPTLRYSREGIRGSFYATENYLSATGPFARLRDKTPPTREDRKGYPVWQGTDILPFLDVPAPKAAPSILNAEALGMLFSNGSFEN